MREWSGHVDKEWLEAWTNGGLTDEEQLFLLAHISGCEYCAGQLADHLEQDGLAEPPAYLREEIMERTKRADIQTVHMVCRTTRQMRLFLYSLKVGLAVVTSLFLLFSTSRIQGFNEEFRALSENKPDISINEKINEKSSQVNDFLQSLTGRFTENLYMEDDYE